MSDTCFAITTSTLSHLLILLVSVDEDILNFSVVHINIFFFHGQCFLYHCKSLVLLQVIKVFYVLFSRSFIMLAFTFSSITHLELIFAWCKVEIKILFLYGYEMHLCPSAVVIEP